MGTIYTNPDGLRNQFGTRKTGDEANFGANGDVGAYKEIVLHLRGSDFTVGTATYNGTTIILPAGATIRESLLETVEVFNLTGTTPTINFGVSGSAATNRMVQVSEAQAEAVGVYNTSASAGGTLAVGTPLAAQSTITVELGGTTPVVATLVGYIRATVRYQDLTPAGTGVA